MVSYYTFLVCKQKENVCDKNGQQNVLRAQPTKVAISAFRMDYNFEITNLYRLLNLNFVYNFCVIY